VVGSAIVEIYTGGIFSDLAVLSLIVTLAALTVVGLAISVFSRRPGQRGARATGAPAAPAVAG